MFGEKMITADQVATICISIVAGLGGGTLLIWGLSSWLGKVWANRLLEKDRLRYNRELEVVKNELGRASQEYLIKFSSLHAERGNIIRDLYKKLMSAQRLMESILKRFQAAGEPPLEEKIKNFVDSFNEFFQFYLDSRIYFPAHLCKQIEDFALKLREIHIDITLYPVNPVDIQYQVSPELLKEQREFWEKARSIFTTQAERLFSTIEAEIRDLLGVEKDSKCVTPANG
jgi:hypothetical protein